MSAPDLVQVIAGVLAGHEAELDTSGDCYTGYCTCNQKVPYVDHAAHQARAVLAAISEAGTVEWGVRTTLGMHVPYDTDDDAQTIAAQHGSTTVSRITGPWTAVVDRD